MEVYTYRARKYLGAYLAVVGHRAPRRQPASGGARAGQRFDGGTWVVWGIGRVLLVALGAGAHLLIAVWHRRGGGSGTQPDQVQSAGSVTLPTLRSAHTDRGPRPWTQAPSSSP